jgi:hypothetical protein
MLLRAFGKNDLGRGLFGVRRLIAAFPFSLSLCFPEEKKREIESGDESPHSKEGVRLGPPTHLILSERSYQLGGKGGA